MIAFLALALAAQMAPPAAAPACAAKVVVPGFETWGTPAGVALAVGRAATLTLQPATAVGYAPPPARAPVAGSFGGVFPLDIGEAGTYRIALGGKAWIDVVGGDTRLVSTAHREGAPCSGIRKIVAFDLQPGRYLVQLSEASGPMITAMVAP